MRVDDDVSRTVSRVGRLISFIWIGTLYSEFLDLSRYVLIIARSSPFAELVA